MRIIGENTVAARTLGGHRQAGNKTGLRDRIMQERLQDRKRELRLREREDERINALHEKMAKINSCEDTSFDLKKLKLSGIAERINRIYEARAEREVFAAEREMMRTKALLEESARAAEEQPNRNESQKDPEEIEEAGQRDSIAGLSRIAAKKDRLSTLSHTRAVLVRDTGYIQRALEHENSNKVKIGVIPGGAGGDEWVLSVQSGRGNPNDFRNRQLNKLQPGIINTTAAIHHTIASMYKESSKMQENRLAVNRAGMHEDESGDKSEEAEESKNELTNVDEEL